MQLDMVSQIAILRAYWVGRRAYFHLTRDEDDGPSVTVSQSGLVTDVFYSGHLHAIVADVDVEIDGVMRGRIVKTRRLMEVPDDAG